MPLLTPATSEQTLAEQQAKNIILQVNTLADRIRGVRANGIPAVPAVEARTLAGGQVIPGRPAVPAISAESINAALGQTNCAILDALSSALQ